jgi:hypothetical protein
MPDEQPNCTLPVPLATLPGPSRRIHVEPLIPEPAPNPSKPSHEPEPSREEPQPEPVPVP